jgi:hypothetical protein
VAAQAGATATGDGRRLDLWPLCGDLRTGLAEDLIGSESSSCDFEHWLVIDLDEGPATAVLIEPDWALTRSIRQWAASKRQGFRGVDEGLSWNLAG